MAFDRSGSDRDKVADEPPAVERRDHAADRHGPPADRSSTHEKVRVEESLREDDDAELLAALRSRNRSEVDAGLNGEDRTTDGGQDGEYRRRADGDDSEKAEVDESGRADQPSEDRESAAQRPVLGDRARSGTESRISVKDSEKAPGTDPSRMIITIEVQKPPVEFPEDDDKKKPSDKFRSTVNRNLDSILKKTQDGVNVTKDILNPPPPTGRSETRVNDGYHINHVPHAAPDLGGMVGGVVLAGAVAAEWIARVRKKHSERDH